MKNQTIQQVINHINKKIDNDLCSDSCCMISLELMRDDIEETFGDTEILSEADLVMRELNTGEWVLNRALSSSYLTDEANKEMAWVVKRQAVPFCDDNGIRWWTGPTAFEALEKAMKAIGKGELK